VEVSVAALYMKEEVASAEVLSDVPRRLEIEYLRGFRAIDFARSTRWFVERNVGKDRYGALEPNIERWNSFYRDVEPGDRYTLTYSPGLGTELALNGVVLGSLPGAELSSAIFSIWLGERPLDAGFKSELLALPPEA
ncbi:MAG: chalcone isomerase family protein, partial [Myxococcales bacterium]|nr:chalcone isomerase family protein [Myxococcales bacterium]